MAVQNLPASGQRLRPAHVPEPGTLMVDIGRDCVGEFRGVAGPHWFLRPVCGGTEWEAKPEHVRLATPAERLSARTARENARSRGEVA